MKTHLGCRPSALLDALPRAILLLLHLNKDKTDSSKHSTAAAPARTSSLLLLLPRGEAALGRLSSLSEEERGGRKPLRACPTRAGPPDGGREGRGPRAAAAPKGEFGQEGPPSAPRQSSPAVPRQTTKCTQPSRQLSAWGPPWAPPCGQSSPAIRRNVLNAPPDLPEGLTAKRLVVPCVQRFTEGRALAAPRALGSMPRPLYYKIGGRAAADYQLPITTNDN